MNERPRLKFSHCCYCDAWGDVPYEQHPTLLRLKELEIEGREVYMLWEDCSVCIKEGAPENTKVLIECELNEAV